MSLYRVHFTWKNKDVTLRARSLEMTHPYLVSIKDLVFSDSPKLIIDPGAEDVRRTFGQAEHIMLPFQTVTLIEEIPEHRSTGSGKIKPLLPGTDSPEEPEEEE